MTLRATLPLVAITSTLLFAAACGEQEPEVTEEPTCELRLADEEGQPFDRLSDYCFFQGELADHEPTEGVFLYDVTAELFSDHSKKKRYIVLPEGETIGFNATDRWTWPDGTILVKTFYYPIDERDSDAGKQILETRLLIKDDESWNSQIYMWDEDQQEAHRNNVGRRVDVTYTNAAGEEVAIDYRIPNRNQCSSCHGQNGDVIPIGPRTRQLTNPFENAPGEPSQLEVMDSLGMFDQPLPDLGTLPFVADPHDESAPLDDRARAYLDANCAHCHNQEGRASSSGLFLDVDITHPTELGICKSPVAAGTGSGGHPYDIVPGHPEDSIMIYRMESTDPSVKMPELPITTIHRFGVDLVSQWISEMEPPGCD